MNTKKIMYRILKIVWFILGGFILFFTGVFFIAMQTFSGSGVGAVGSAIGLALIFALFLGILIAYILITLLFLLIKWIVKKWKKKK
jgi:hypothetical protein